MTTKEVDEPMYKRGNKKSEMNELLYRDEMLWLQRSRIVWLKEGDRNTKKFHGRAVWRARKNNLKGLLDGYYGNWHTQLQAMQELAKNYFEQLFTADMGLDQEPVVNLFRECITDEMNSKLCSSFTHKEISDAVFQIGALKSLGPDGFPARFFQRHWAILKRRLLQRSNIFL